MKIWTTKSPLFPESWKYWKLKSPTFSIILEILEIGFFSIFSHPGNTGNRFFLIFSYLGNAGNRFFPIFSYPGNTGNRIFLFPHILERRVAGGRRRAGGSRGCVVLPWIIFGTCSWKNEHGNLGIKVKTTTLSFLKMASQAKPLCS